jgi:O-antigen/teichoic acid export membrane protein
LLRNNSGAAIPRAAPNSRRRRVRIGIERRKSLESGGHLVIMIAAALCSTTVVTASLGFVFWASAAHLTTPEIVGRSAAVISAMEFIATFATLGLHTLLIAELPRRDGEGVKRLVVTCFGIAGCVAFAAAAGFAFVHHIIDESDSMFATPIGVVLFGIGTAVSTVTIVVDGALIGVRQSGRQVSRNLVFAIAKLLALPCAALAVGLSPQMIFLVWLFGNLVSLLVLALRTKALPQWLKTSPSIRGFAPIWRTAAGHHWVNVATQTPRLALPVIVATQLGAVANAGFYAALLMITFIWIIPNHLGTAMFALHSGDPQHFRAGLDTAIRLSAVAAVGGPILARPLLSIFGPAYVEARYCFMALAICTFAGAVKSIYIAVRRAQGALSTAARAAVLGAALELTAAEVGLILGGVTGLGIALATAAVVEAAFFWPAILKARRQSHEAAAPETPSDLDRQSSRA